MSKKKKAENAFFLNEYGRISLNTLCRRCIHDCKQSKKAIVIECANYTSKRAKKQEKAKYGE